MAWYNTRGPLSDTVISSRVRLARNITGYPFPSRLDANNANEIIEKILKHPHGIILLTGPTGCGKTTTLYAFLKELNKETKNLITIEDPVEYSMNGINQIQIKPSTSYHYKP